MAWIALAVLASAALTSGQETCLSGEEDPYLMFGTKTAYTFVTGGKTNNRVQDVLGCTPIAFWLLNGRGSHIPEADEIPDLMKLQDLKENVLNNYRSGNYRNTNQRLCPADLNLLERWSWNPRHNATFAGDLTSDGYLTTQQLAQGWRQRFPGILADNRHDYQYKYSSDKVSRTSYVTFTEGLFRSELDDYDIPKQNNDQLLNPYKSCPAWTKDVEQNNETYSQLHIFESKQEYRQMISNISLRLGFNYDMDVASIKRMYLMCRYNKAWDVIQISPWCAAFTREDLRRLEYAEDLETYYKFGYGSPLNQKVACPLVKDMLDFFKLQVERADTPQQPRALINFADAQSILLLHAALGSHRGVTPLTGDNYRTQVQSRKWTSSTMAPFNGNLAAILYRCNTNNNYQIQEQFQVLFLENEQQMYLDDCRVGLCPWSVVRQRYGSFAENCDGICNGATIANGFLASCLAVAALLVRLM